MPARDNDLAPLREVKCQVIAVERYVQRIGVSLNRFAVD